MKKDKRVKPVEFFDYSLLITKRYKEREKKTVTLVALRTIKEFSNFRYEIIVQDSVDDKTLRLDVRGLRAPQQTIPGSGPALFTKEYDGLHGTYKIIVTKLDKTSNTFLVDIGEEHVKLLQSPVKKFITLTTNEQDW
jgi:hypothetical protein